MTAAELARKRAAAILGATRCARESGQMQFVVERYGRVLILSDEHFRVLSWPNNLFWVEFPPRRKAS